MSYLGHDHSSPSSTLQVMPKHSTENSCDIYMCLIRIFAWILGNLVVAKIGRFQTNSEASMVIIVNFFSYLILLHHFFTIEQEIRVKIIKNRVLIN